MSRERDEVAKQPSELYDFAYRDSERIASYYAQIWNGRLLSVEQTSSEVERSEETLKGTVQVASTESKIVSDQQFQQKGTIDMHDAATVDLLLRLAAQRAEKKEFGSIHVLSGTCFFIDRNILKYAGPAIDASMRSPLAIKPSSPKQAKEQKAARESAETIKQMLSILDMPSGFVLQVSEDRSVCGPIKDLGLDQPISSLLLRAGSYGIRNTYVVGMTEEFATGPTSISPMADAQSQFAETMLSLLFPLNAIRMIPLAIYRNISI